MSDSITLLTHGVIKLGDTFTLNDRMLGEAPQTFTYRRYTNGVQHGYPLQPGMKGRLVAWEQSSVNGLVSVQFEILDGEQIIRAGAHNETPFTLGWTYAERWFMFGNECAECDERCPTTDYLCLACRGNH